MISDGRDALDSTKGMATRVQNQTGHRLLQLGVALFLLGLLTGLAVPGLANPRMALASHLEGLMNGLFLIALGLMWPRVALSARLASVTFWLACYGTFANWAATLPDIDRADRRAPWCAVRRPRGDGRRRETAGPGRDARARARDPRPRRSTVAAGGADEPLGVRRRTQRPAGGRRIGLGGRACPIGRSGGVVLIARLLTS